MPSFVTQYRVLTMNMPVNGDFTSVTGVGVSVYSPQITTIDTTVDLIDFSASTFDSRTNSTSPAPANATNQFYGADQVVMMAPGHAAGYLVDVQGTTSTKEIQLKGNTGNAGDIIIQTNDGPEWRVEYYSTIYDLDAQAIHPVPITWESVFKIIDPANGFTQYVDNPTGARYDIGLPANLTPGVRHCVRVEITNYADNHGFIDPTTDHRTTGLLGVITWAESGDMNASVDMSATGTKINVFEFYTRNGGASWIGYRLSGMSSLP